MIVEKQFIKRRFSEYESTLGPKLILIAEKPLSKDRLEIFDSPRGMNYLSYCFRSKFKSAETHVTYINDSFSTYNFSREVFFNIIQKYFQRKTLHFNELIIGFVGQSALDAFVSDYKSSIDPVGKFIYISTDESYIMLSDDEINRFHRYKIPFLVLPSIDSDSIEDLPRILNETSVGQHIVQSPYISTSGLISRIDDILKAYKKNLITAVRFDAKYTKHEPLGTYFKIYDVYTNNEVLYCKADEICKDDSTELQELKNKKLKELLTTVPIYSRDKENLEETLKFFKYRDEIKVIDEDEAFKEDLSRISFKCWGNPNGEKSKWYHKWYYDVFKPRLRSAMTVNEIKASGYDDTEKYEWIYDIEVFKYDWLFIAKTLDGKNKVICWNDAENLSKWIKNKILIGFNNAAYDDGVIRYAMLYPYTTEGTPTVKEFSDATIEDKPINKFPDLKRTCTKKTYEYAPNFLSWDLSFHLPFDIRRNSLKKLTMSVLNKRNYDSSVPFNIDQKLSMQQREEVERYCELDVDNTLELFLPDPKDVEAAKTDPKHEFREFASDSYDIRWNLIVEYKMGAKTLINKDASFAGKVLCGEKAKPNLKNTLKEINGKKVFYSIPELAYTELEGTSLLDFYVKNQQNPGYITEKFEYYMGGNDEGHQYQFGFGGLHQALLNYGSKNLVNMDVASLYPSLLVHYNLMSRGAINNPGSYEEIYHTRLKAKKEGKTLLNKGLKLILNGAIGACLSEFNPLFDTWTNSTVCVHGQLLLFILCKRLYEAGFNIVQTNTDGIMIERQENVDYMPICEKWMQETKLILEFDEIAILQQNNVNNYYCQFTNGKIKSKGFYLSNEKFGKATSKILCNLVTEKPVYEGVEPRDYVIYKRHGVGEIYSAVTREKLDGRSLAFVVGYPNDPRTQAYYSRSKNEREVKLKDNKGKPILDENGQPITEIVNSESKITGFTDHMLLIDDVNKLTIDEINKAEYVNFAKNLLNKKEDFGPYYNENFVKCDEPELFQALNALKDNTAEHPTNAGVVCQNLLFECDYATKEEQEEMIANCKDSLYRVVWSGSKSYHCVVRLDRPVTVTAYKKIWRYLQYKLGFIEADEQSALPSKYTRVPDQINTKTGNVQTLYSFDKNILSVDDILENMPRFKEVTKKITPYKGQVTIKALERHINRLDWSDGNRFVACQKLSPVLISQVSLEELLKMIPVKLEKDHLYVIRAKYHYFEKYKALETLNVDNEEE